MSPLTAKQERLLLKVTKLETRQRIRAALNEIDLATEQGKYLVCLDEVGWGALAGPLTVAATHIPRVHEHVLYTGGIIDSKALHNAQVDSFGLGACDQKAAWFYDQVAQLHGVASAVAHIDAGSMDRLGNGVAKALAFRNAAYQLIYEAGMQKEDVVMVIDGDGTNLWLKGDNVQQIAIPKGDAFVMGISMASILAKSNRDLTMRVLAEHHPGYYFAERVGYPTPEHTQAILQFGLIPGVHRESYCQTTIMNYYKKARECGDTETVKTAPAWVKERGWHKMVEHSKF